jgi:hypothetical protein
VGTSGYFYAQLKSKQVKDGDTTINVINDVFSKSGNSAKKIRTVSDLDS